MFHLGTGCAHNVYKVIVVYIHQADVQGVGGEVDGRVCGDGLGLVPLVAAASGRIAGIHQTVVVVLHGVWHVQKIRVARAVHVQHLDVHVLQVERPPGGVVDTLWSGGIRGREIEAVVVQHRVIGAEAVVVGNGYEHVRQAVLVDVQEIDVGIFYRYRGRVG